MYSVIVVIFVSQVFYSYSEETSKSKQYTRYKFSANSFVMSSSINAK